MRSMGGLTSVACNAVKVVGIHLCTFFIITRIDRFVAQGFCIVADADRATVTTYFFFRRLDHTLDRIGMKSILDAVDGIE